MKSFRKASLALLVIGILSVLVAPTFAQLQRTVTITFTEEEINTGFRITNPARVTISNKSVDLQNGQVVVTATYTPRRSTGASYTVSTTLVPTVSNGRVTWTATSIVVNGSSITDQQLSVVNTVITNAWGRLSRGHTGSGNITALSITDTDITYTVIRGS
ncbi:MAG: hypothetical protein SFZ02_09215 [bacterium]|nr:hypothetical protein [bacterium]